MRVIFWHVLQLADELIRFSGTMLITEREEDRIFVACFPIGWVGLKFEVRVNVETTIDLLCYDAHFELGRKHETQ